LWHVGSAYSLPTTFVCGKQNHEDENSGVRCSLGENAAETEELVAGTACS